VKPARRPQTQAFLRLHGGFATVAATAHPTSVHIPPRPLPPRASRRGPGRGHRSLPSPRSQPVPSNGLPEIVIVSGARTPMAEWIGGKRGDGLQGGALASVSAVLLCAGRATARA